MKKGDMEVKKGQQLQQCIGQKRSKNNEKRRYRGKCVNNDSNVLEKKAQGQQKRHTEGKNGQQ